MLTFTGRFYISISSAPFVSDFRAIHPLKAVVPSTPVPLLNNVRVDGGSIGMQDETTGILDFQRLGQFCGQSISYVWYAKSLGPPDGGGSETKISFAGRVAEDGKEFQFGTDERDPGIEDPRVRKVVSRSLVWRPRVAKGGTTGLGRGLQVEGLGYGGSGSEGVQHGFTTSILMSLPARNPERRRGSVLEKSDELKTRFVLSMIAIGILWTGIRSSKRARQTPKWAQDVNTMAQPDWDDVCTDQGNETKSSRVQRAKEMRGLISLCRLAKHKATWSDCLGEKKRSVTKNNKKQEIPSPPPARSRGIPAFYRSGMIRQDSPTCCSQRRRGHGGVRKIGGCEWSCGLCVDSWRVDDRGFGQLGGASRVVPDHSGRNDTAFENLAAGAAVYTAL
ncbi:hypothetical protein B0H14DRAFT_2631651 [Mycena olivaceomarginata]|nr:hypothetical protein B0H14DRAFT_2631651 [Mycena olivaceomarginata]